MADRGNNNMLFLILIVIIIQIIYNHIAGSFEFCHLQDFVDFSNSFLFIYFLILGMCLDWYGQRRSSILLQSACDHVATAAETVTVSRLWSAMSVKQHK